MTPHTASQADRKAIVTLADSFRKLLSLRILASGLAFSLRRRMRMPNNGEIGFSDNPLILSLSDCAVLYALSEDVYYALLERWSLAPQDSSNSESCHSQFGCSRPQRPYCSRFEKGSSSISEA
jgi:hypothetical protein